MTLIQALDHYEYACRAAAIIFAGCLVAALIGYWVSDREVGDE